jgi:hypothetical protein
MASKIIVALLLAGFVPLVLFGAGSTVSFAQGNPTATLVPIPFPTTRPTSTITPTISLSSTVRPASIITPTIPVSSTIRPASAVTPTIPLSATVVPTALATALPTGTPLPTVVPTVAATLAPIVLPTIEPSPSPQPTATSAAFGLLGSLPAIGDLAQGDTLVPIIAGGVGLIVVVLLMLWLSLALRKKKKPAPPAAPPPAPRVMARLEGLNPAGLGFAILKETVTLGRSPDSDLAISDKLPGGDTVSSHHARLERREGRWVVVDGVAGGALSTNGVCVNGKRTLENFLAENDEISLGEVKFRFHEMPVNADAEGKQS